MPDAAAALRWWRANTARLASPIPWSRAVTIGVVTVPAVGAAIVDTARRPETWTVWLPALILLTLAEYAVLRAVRGPMIRAASALATVAVYALLAAARSWLLEAVVVARVNDAAFAARPVPAIILSIGALIILSEIVDRAQIHHEASVALTATQDRLLAAANTFDSEVSQTRARLRSQIHDSLDPALREVLRELQDPPGDAVTGGTAARTVHETLRPLLARLAADGEQSAVGQVPARAATSRFTLPERVDVRASLRPLRIAFAEALLVLPWAALATGQRDTSVLLPILGFIWGVGIIVAFRLLIARWRPELPFRAAVIAFSAVFLLAIVPPQLGFAQRSLRFDDAYVGVRWMLIVMLFTIAWLVTAAAMIDARLTQVEGELARANADLETLVARLRRELWYVRRRLSWVLHGPVQSALVAASLRLAASSDGIDTSELRRNLEIAIEQVDRSDDTVADLEFAISQITGVWAGTCNVLVDATPDAMDVLHVSPSAGAAITEVIREGVGNAVRHGSATQVRVRIDRSGGEHCVRVTVDDDGSGIAPGAQPGLGSSILDDVAMAWSRSSRQPRGTRLVADVAV